VITLKVRQNPRYSTTSYDAAPVGERYPGPMTD
jgi:hypothetical protein